MQFVVLLLSAVLAAPLPLDDFEKALIGTAVVGSALLIPGVRNPLIAASKSAGTSAATFGSQAYASTGAAFTAMGAGARPLAEKFTTGARAIPLKTYNAGAAARAATARAGVNARDATVRAGVSARGAIDRFNGMTTAAYNKATFRNVPTTGTGVAPVAPAPAVAPIRANPEGSIGF